MSAAERRRIRRKKKFVRNVKRTFTSIVLAPARMPRITAERAERVMRYCEIAAVCFVAVLIVHMAAPEIVGKLFVIAAGLVFAALLGILGLSDYQDKLVEYELYGFKI